VAVGNLAVALIGRLRLLLAAHRFLRVPYRHAAFGAATDVRMRGRSCPMRLPLSMCLMMRSYRMYPAEPDDDARLFMCGSVIGNLASLCLAFAEAKKARSLASQKSTWDENMRASCIMKPSLTCGASLRNSMFRIPQH